MKLALLLACCALPATAATLKPYTALTTSVVRLSDLFEGADDRPLGPGPLPGARIVVEVRQLTAIARMFGVDWRPAGSERAVLERPGRPLAKEDVMAALRAVLDAAGAPRDSDIELPGFSTPPLPTGGPPVVEFENTSFDAATGRFTTMLVATAEDVPQVRVRLSGRVQEMVVLPVPRRAMMPGDVIAPGDLQWTRMRVGLARGELVRFPVQAENQATRRPLQPNQPILLADLGRPVIVAKGAPLLLEFQAPGLQVTAQGIAAEPGGVGERIHVTNPHSRAVIEAEITGPGRARVVPSAAPTQVAAR